MTETPMLDKAREMLCDMTVIIPTTIPTTRSELSALMWEAFTKGRKYGEFVTEAKDKRKDEQIETAMLNLFCGVWQLQENIEAFFKGIENKTFEELLAYIEWRK